MCVWGVGAQATPLFAVEFALMFYLTFMWYLRNLFITNPRNFSVGKIQTNVSFSKRQLHHQHLGQRSAPPRNICWGWQKFVGNLFGTSFINNLQVYLRQFLVALNHGLVLRVLQLILLDVGPHGLSHLENKQKN